MFQANENNIRPRKNVPGWFHSPQFLVNNLNEPSYIEKDFRRFENLPPKRMNFSNFNREETKHYDLHTEAVKKYVQDYCEYTTLHGLRYVGTKNVSPCERIFWFLAFLGAISFAAFFITNIYQRWINNPLIVGIDPEYKSIFEIPFPAITICNMNQAMKVEAEKVLKGKDENEKWLLDDICNSKDNYSYVNQSEEHTTKWEFIKKFILKVSQPCNSLLVQCKWQGYDIPCEKIFNSALTDEGVCCTFNRVHNKYMYHNPSNVADLNLSYPLNNINWTPEDGYPPNSNNTTWPYRGMGAGEELGLTLIINVAADEYYCSSTSSVGLKTRLHSPVETPMMADYGFLLHPRKEVRVTVRPSMDEASTSINKIPVHRRQCFFSVEKPLFYYRTYTKMNCELECLSNYTLDQCSCVPFYLPKNINISICSKRKEFCYLAAKTKMTVELRPSKYCNCLPACNEISYGQDHSLGDISKPELRKGSANLVEPSSLIILHVFYQQTYFRSYEKSEIFGFTEFLSNSGGLLGLFLGFSFLSAVEIIYHLTLRLWCVYYRRYKEQEKNKTVYPFTQ